MLKQKRFWIGFACFILTLLPQVIFDLRHQFIMSKAILRHLSGNTITGINILRHFQDISLSFYNTFSATLMNHKLFTLIILLLAVPTLLQKGKDKVILVSLVFVAVPFLGYLILPVNVNPWHLGGEMSAALILVAYFLKKRILIPFSILIIWFGLLNIFNFFTSEFIKPNSDPSLYKNEIAAINYVYKIANGKNFKVYTYLPSVYDYPYQYLFWWYGQKKYGYLPVEYAYAPNKPQYIPSQDKFQSKSRHSSGMVFLIKEPNQNYTRFGWEGNFVKLKSVGKKMVSSLEIEIMKE